MTDETPRPKRMRRPAEPEKLAPGLYGVGRFGDRHDLTDANHKWLSHMADADLYAMEGYLRHALARAEHERMYRETDHMNRLSRALDLRDAEPTNLPQRRPTIMPANTVNTAANRPSLEILERVAEGLRAEELAADPAVRAVMDDSVDKFERARDEAGPIVNVVKLSEAEELPPDIAAKVDEALADPSKFVTFNRAEREAKRAGRRAKTGAELAASFEANEPDGTGGTTRPPQPWDNDTDDPWRDVGGE